MMARRISARVNVAKCLVCGDNGRGKMYAAITDPNTPCLQMMLVGHKAQTTEQESLAGLNSGLQTVLKAPGVLKAWRGIKHEEIQVYVILILWENYIASMNFFTSKQCRVVSDAWYPFLAGRELFTRRHILVHDLKQLEQAISTKAIEVAMTRVKPGRVADYYEALWRVVHKVLSNDPGCDGYYINSVLEDPDWQVNPRVDAHNMDFVKNPGFNDCISALWDHYYSLPTPWHIKDIQLIFEKGV